MRTPFQISGSWKSAQRAVAAARACLHRVGPVYVVWFRVERVSSHGKRQCCPCCGFSGARSFGLLRLGQLFLATVGTCCHPEVRFCKDEPTCLSFASASAPCADEDPQSRTSMWRGLECYQFPLSSWVHPFIWKPSVGLPKSYWFLSLGTASDHCYHSIIPSTRTRHSVQARAEEMWDAHDRQLRHMACISVAGGGAQNRCRDMVVFSTLPHLLYQP